jgi:hypothetical protein
VVVVGATVVEVVVVATTVSVVVVDGRVVVGASAAVTGGSVSSGMSLEAAGPHAVATTATVTKTRRNGFCLIDDNVADVHKYGINRWSRTG